VVADGCGAIVERPGLASNLDVDVDLDIDSNLDVDLNLNVISTLDLDLDRRRVADSCPAVGTR
jgi:hypothetical protein